MALDDNYRESIASTAARVLRIADNGQVCTLTNMSGVTVRVLRDTDPIVRTVLDNLDIQYELFFTDGETELITIPTTDTSLPEGNVIGVSKENNVTTYVIEGLANVAVAALEFVHQIAGAETVVNPQEILLSQVGNRLYWNNTALVVTVPVDNEDYNTLTMVGGGDQFADQMALETFISDAPAFRLAIQATTTYIQPTLADSPDQITQIGERVTATQLSIFGNVYQRIFIAGTFDETNLFTNVDRWMLIYDNSLIRDGAALGVTSLQPGDVVVNNIHVGDFVAPLAQAFVVGAFNLDTDHLQVNDINGDSFADSVVPGEKMRVELLDGTFADFTIVSLNTAFPNTTLVTFTGELPNNINTGAAITVNQSIVTELDDTSTVTVAVDDAGKTGFNVVTTLDGDGNIATLGGTNIGGISTIPTDVIRDADFLPTTGDITTVNIDGVARTIASGADAFIPANNAEAIKIAYESNDDTNAFTDQNNIDLGNALQGLPSGTLTLTSNTDGVFVFAVEGGAPITIDPADDDVSINSELTEITIGTSVFTKFALTDAQIASLVAADNAIPSNTLLPATGDITSIGGRTIASGADAFIPADNAEAIKTAYESNADTNVFTDQNNTDLGTALQPTDLLPTGTGDITSIDGRTIGGDFEIIDENDGDVLEIWTGTEAEYDATVPKDPNTLYQITDDFVGAMEGTPVVLVLTSITLDDVIFTGTAEIVNITITGDPGTQFNLSVVSTDPLGWLTAGALGATSGTIPTDGTFETTLSIPGTELTVDREAAIRAIASLDATNIVTTGLFRQQHAEEVADGDLVFSSSDLVIGTMITLSVDITAGDQPFTLELFDVDPSVGSPTPLETQTQTAIGTYAFMAIDTTTLPVGDNTFFLRVTDTDGDTAVEMETITIAEPSNLLYQIPTDFYPSTSDTSLSILFLEDDTFDPDTRTLTATSEITDRTTATGTLIASPRVYPWGFANVGFAGETLDPATDDLTEPFNWSYNDVSVSPSVVIASGRSTYHSFQPLSNVVANVPNSSIIFSPPVSEVDVNFFSSGINVFVNGDFDFESGFLEYEQGTLTEFTSPSIAFITVGQIGNTIISANNTDVQSLVGIYTFRFTMVRGGENILSPIRTINIT